MSSRDLVSVIEGLYDFRMSRRQALKAAGAGAAAAALAARGRAFQAHAQENLEDELVFRTWGGAMTDALAEAWVKPFEEKFGVKVIMDTGELPEVQLQQQAGNPQFDIVLLNRLTVHQLKGTDVLETIDAAKIPNLASVYPQLLNPLNLSIPGYFGEMGLVYNTEKVTTNPTSLGELWNPAHKGHVVLPTGVDGGDLFTPPAAKYAGTTWDGDLAPYWAKLKELQPNVLTQYSSAGQMLNLLETEDAWIGPWYNGRGWNAIAQGLPLAYITPSEGATIVLIDAVIAKGNKHPNAAYTFLNHALETTPQQQFAELFSYAPSRKDVTVAEDKAKTMPFGEEGIGKLIVPDWDKFVELRTVWAEEWNKTFGAPS